MPKTNQAGLALIESFEGLALAAYPDDGGVWTIGYGHTLNVHPGQTCTRAQALAWLASDVHDAERVVEDAVEVVLTPNQFAALVSFEYNTGALTSSPGLALLNAEDFPRAWDQHFMLYTNPDPVGLGRRRAAERALFFTKG